MGLPLGAAPDDDSEGSGSDSSEEEPFSVYRAHSKAHGRNGFVDASHARVPVA